MFYLKLKTDVLIGTPIIKRKQASIKSVRRIKRDRVVVAIVLAKTEATELYSDIIAVAVVQSLEFISMV